MIKIKHQIRQRNWVAKHDRNRSARHRSAMDYRRQPKHRNQKELA